MTAVTEDPLLLLVGAVAIAYAIASVGIVPYVARAKRRSGPGWALLSLLVTPVITLLALAAIPPRGGDVDELAACPYCAEDVKADAVVCPHCRSNLESAMVGRLKARKS
ncbi:MAG: hypothetical protein DME12_11915 [Candidatus Rokuibacteriota bacterium]|nr:MAG: hypothetical protein DME12_11915 [Candidatus Rokubacteria bacterium]PYM62890.1 MAG: hypothetical protein DME11_18330 [Candidatus Rokubacteria bacterium]PYN66906.1 MAG: hypothetical protein DMD93_15915 [Candidatus Rokubacteria bacterium]